MGEPMGAQHQVPMIMRIRLPIAMILLAAAATPALANEKGLWSNLEALKSGARIGIIQSDTKSIEGYFESFRDSDITLRADRAIVVPKDKVVRVYRRPRMNRTVRALVGAAIGAIAGAILNATVGQYYRNEGPGQPAGVWIGAGAGIGAGIGAVTGGGRQTVYQRLP